MSSRFIQQSFFYKRKRAYALSFLSSRFLFLLRIDQVSDAALAIPVVIRIAIHRDRRTGKAQSLRDRETIPDAHRAKDPRQDEGRAQTKDEVSQNRKDRRRLLGTQRHKHTVYDDTAGRKDRRKQFHR